MTVFYYNTLESSGYFLVLEGCIAITLTENGVS